MLHEMNEFVMIGSIFDKIVFQLPMSRSQLKHNYVKYTHAKRVTKDTREKFSCLILTTPRGYRITSPLQGISNKKPKHYVLRGNKYTFKGGNSVKNVLTSLFNRILF